MYSVVHLQNKLYANFKYIFKKNYNNIQNSYHIITS